MPLVADVGAVEVATMGNSSSLVAAQNSLVGASFWISEEKTISTLPT